MEGQFTYEDFDLLIEPGPPGSYRARVLRSPAGESASVQFTVPFSSVELENFVLKVGRPRRGTRGPGRPESAPLKDFGGKLYGAVFQDELRDTLLSSLRQTRAHGVGMRLRLRMTDTPELAELPWEFLYDPRLNRFLAQSRHTPLVRFLDLPDPPRPLGVEGPLRLLVIISNPTEYPALDVEQEWSALTHALAQQQAEGRVIIERLTANMSTLRRKLRRDAFHLFHFVGHGRYRPDWGDGTLVMEDRNGRPHEVTGEELGGLLNEYDQTRLAVLNACEGARSGVNDPFAGMAQSLIQQGLPAVVAMQFEVTDDAAIIFGREFYGAIADGYPLEAAMAEARGAIRDEGNFTEWGTPVLYSRAPDGRLFDLTAREQISDPKPRAQEEAADKAQQDRERKAQTESERKAQETDTMEAVEQTAACPPAQLPRTQVAALPTEDEQPAEQFAAPHPGARDDPGGLATGPGDVSDAGHTALSEMIASLQQARSTADLAIRGLAEVADNLDMHETADRLCQTGEQLRSDTFKLIVMGRFKNGKSTLVNALLRRTTQPITLHGHKGPMAVDEVPATATLTGVRYAEKPYVLAWGFDGKAEPWSFAKYLDESSLGTDELESQRRFQVIKEFEMGYPARLCREGVLVYDSPGLDEHDDRTAITRDAAKRCDAAIIVCRSDALMGQTELYDTASVVAEGARLFTVVNLWNGKQVDDQLRGFVWNRYVRDHGGEPAWNNQDLSQHDIYFVDAIQARDGRCHDDGAEVEASGLADFERALARFLIDERQQVHLQKFVTLAFNLSATIEARITQRQKAAQLDREDLKTAYAEALPKLAAIRARSAKLPEIFARYRAEAEATLTSSFAQLVARIRAELPVNLESRALPSGKKYTKVFQLKKLLVEAETAISDFVSARIETWCTQDVKAELAPILERLGNKIASDTTEVGQLNEILEVLGAELRLSFTLSVPMFLTTALLVARLNFGILIPGADLETRVKRKVLANSDEILARVPEEFRAAMATKVAASFEFLETAVTKAALTDAAAAVAQHRLTLQQALGNARHTG